MKKKSFEPHDLVTIQLPTSKRRRVVEVISRPIPPERFSKPETIMVRMVPGEPTTIEEVAVVDLRPSPSGLPSGEKFTHIYAVDCGGFAFPEDMLRRDGMSLCDHRQHELGICDMVPEFRPTEPVFIYRISQHKSPARDPLTVVRWKSFGCSVRLALVRRLQTEEVLYSAPTSERASRNPSENRNLSGEVELQLRKIVGR